MGPTARLLSVFLLAILAAESVNAKSVPAFDRHNQHDETKEDKESEKDKEKEYRLPKSIVPKSYKISYDSVGFKDADFKFHGTVSIKANVVMNDTKEIVLHHGALTTNVSSIETANGILQHSEPTYKEKTEKLTIRLQKSLKEKDEITIKLSFNGTLRDTMNGFYRSSYYDDKGVQRWLASTQFEGTSARHAFPCFDEPQLKARFTVSIRPPSGFKCLGNMPLLEVKNGICEFEESVPMSSYLVAFVISEFESKSDEANKFHAWARPNAIDQAAEAVRIGTAALGYLENLFEEPYSLSKMDMVAVPDFAAGAMENWGLMTFRETASLYERQVSSIADHQRVASVIVHECTHMWFGNLVTPKWWSWLWLSEAFARYYQYMATAQIEKSWKMDEQFVVEQHQVAFGVDGLESSSPMTRAAVTPSEIGNTGDAITYSKGASIVRMMEKTFGLDLFNAALRDYIKDRKYNSSESRYLWKAFQGRVNEKKDPKLNVSVAEVMKTWTEQAGFPYVTVTIEQEIIHLSQQRFLLRHENAVPSNDLWWIPISWMAASKVNDPHPTKPVHWLSERDGSVKNEYGNDDWLILNVQSAGFYRVNYDPKSWSKIFKALDSQELEKIHVLNRAAIVDDLLNLARAEILKYETALRGLQYLKRETNYLPFKSAFNGLDYLIRKFSAHRDNESFKQFVLSLFEHIYEKITYDDLPNDDHLTILLRRELNSRACSLGYSKCIVKSQAHFSKWRKQNIPIPKNQRLVAYCTAISEGDEEDWTFLWEKYREANVGAEQQTILSALGCSKNKQVLENYLLRALTSFEESRIRKQDISAVFSGVYSASKEGAEYVLDFVEKHHEPIRKYHKGYDEIASLVSGALGKYPSQVLVNRVEDMIKANKTYVTKIIPSLEKALKAAEFELAWSKKYTPIIINWIKENDAALENTTAYRLPNSIIPTHYRIHLSPNFDAFNFTGSVTIFARVNESTEKIVLHTDLMDLEKVQVFKLDEKNNSLTDLPIDGDITYAKKYHFTRINLKSVVEAGTPISIKVSYRGVLSDEMKGFYRSSYKVEGKPRWLAATQLEPVGARRVFPCFDEPALKATFDISVDVPTNYTAVSNMKLKSKDNGVWVFDTTPIMSTYLVAVAVSDFSVKSTEYEGHSYGALANPLVAHQLDYSLGVMGPVVEFFETRLNHGYDLPKLDMIALPDFSSGAMENWGLMTFRETNLLYDPATMSSLSSKQSIRNVIAHEISHQWFGDLVSPLWWDYLWLSEGFARYFQCHAYFEHQEEASWKLDVQFVVDHLQSSFGSDATTSTHPVSHKVHSPSEIKAIFDKISYAKAASLIRMLHKIMGSKMFYDALYDYLKSCKHSTGTPEALFDAFARQLYLERIDLDVRQVMRNWTLQAGFPVVSVTFEKDSALLSQQRFYSRPQTKVSDQTWIVPITYATRSKPNLKDTGKVTWFAGKEKAIQVERSKDEWAVVNVQQTGYYRVNYDVPMWRLIVEALNSDERELIHEVNRAALLDDLLNLGRAGMVDYRIVLSGAECLANEAEYAPWKAALAGFKYLNRRFVGRPEIYDAYKTYLVRLLESAAHRLGYEEGAEERHTDTLLRKLLLEWLCEFEHEKCVNEAVKLFEKEQRGEKSVAPNYQPFVYCTAIRHAATDENWTYLWKKYEKSYYATEKLTLQAALACTKNRDLLNKLLSDAITPDSDVRLQDAKKIFTNVVESGLIGVEATLDFIGKRYADMNKYFGDDSIAKSTLSSISKRLSTDELVKKFEDFVNQSTKLMPNLESSLKSSLNRSKNELKWYKDNYPRIFRQLEISNQKQKEIDYRLPLIAKPINYDIELKPDLEKTFTFDGKVTIDIKVENDTLSIILHADDIDISSITEADANFTVSNFTVDPVTQKLYVYFNESLPRDSTIKLVIVYVGHMRDDMRGFYRSSYTDENGKKQWLASTHFEPTYARRAFPCFDEPIFKAKFTIRILRSSEYGTLSNMGSSPTSKPEGKNHVWDIYPESIKMSSYLVAFVVSKFVKVPAAKSFVSAWARPQLKDYMEYAPKAGEITIQFLKNFTSVDYPLDEMNFVAVPDFDMGAMENWGLVTYREYGLTYDVAKISATYKRYVDTVISHELVHMWFGDLVTCEWWDYTWLNEGFAEYLEYIVSNARQPSWQLLKQFVVKELHLALDVDSSEATHPMNNKVITPVEAQDGFDKIAYQKSASVLRMFHNSFGPEIFVEALQNYLKAHSKETVRPEHLYEAIQNRVNEVGGKVAGGLDADIATVMKSWTEQSGYPVVSATRDKTKVTLSQKRFVVSPSESSELDEVYRIPVTYTTESELNFETLTPRLWLDGKDKTINIAANDTWYILNIQEVGFYRVNYDEENWKQLIKVLNSDNFNVIGDINRAQIIDDSLNLAKAGLLDYEIALDATKYLTRETNYFSWAAHFSAVAYLGQRIEGNPEMRKLYSRHILKLLDNVYNKLGFEEDMAKDEHLDQLNRELILTWACKYGHEHCMKQAKEYFKKPSVTPNIASTVYCTAIKHGNSNDWESLLKKYSKALLATDYITILKGLGCSKNTTILEKYLDLALDTEYQIRRQDIATAFSSIYTSSQIGLETAINYFKNNLDKLHIYFKNWNDVGSLFTSLAGRITTEKQINILEQLVSDESTTVANIKTSLRSAIKVAKKNQEWFQKHSTKIYTWLKDNYYPETTLEPTEPTTRNPGSENPSSSAEGSIGTSSTEENIGISSTEGSSETSSTEENIGASSTVGSTGTQKPTDKPESDTSR